MCVSFSHALAGLDCSMDSYKTERVPAPVPVMSTGSHYAPPTLLPTTLFSKDGDLRCELEAIMMQ